MTYIATAAVSFIIGSVIGWFANAYLSKEERDEDALHELPPTDWNPEVTWRGYDHHGNYRGN